jgi:hypothetical protein
MVASHHPSQSVSSVSSKITFTALLNSLHFHMSFIKGLINEPCSKARHGQVERCDALWIFFIDGSETGLGDTPSVTFHALHCQQLSLVAFGEGVVAKGEPNKIKYRRFRFVFEDP